MGVVLVLDVVVHEIRSENFFFRGDSQTERVFDNLQGPKELNGMRCPRRSSQRQLVKLDLSLYPIRNVQWELDTTMRYLP